MTDLRCDVAIIGAGTAGLAAERSARRAGARTLLIDDQFAGTTCATVGCMPSKLLIAAAHAAHAVRSAKVFGIDTPEPTIDGAAVMRRVRELRDAFVQGALKSIEQIPDGIRIRGRAHFTSPTMLTLGDNRRVSARAVVIATGSEPQVPPMFEALGECVLTNETLFELTCLPASVAVIGAGPLGLELAQALARLGVDTAVFDNGKWIAGLQDDEVARELHSILERELPIRLGVTLSVARARDGVGATISWSGPSSGEKRFERVLVATGRPPRLKGLDLARAGLALDENGAPRFDAATLQCGDAPVFIAGDADGQRAVLHEASSEGAIAGRNAASFPSVHPSKRSPAFSIVFTDPPVAVVGEPAGAATVVGRVSYSDQGRAKVEARNAGLVHFYADVPDGRLVGATMLGPGMEHLAHLIVWAVERGETASSLLELPFYHPTFEEGLKPGLRQICETVHALMASDRDQGSPFGA